MEYKIFDAHIGLSDAIVMFGKDPLNTLETHDIYKNQFNFEWLKQIPLKGFIGVMCPLVEESSGHFILPKDIKSEIQKHLDVYKKLEREGRLNIVLNREHLSKPGFNVVVGLEGVYFVNSKDDIAHLDKLYAEGVRLIGPYWNFENQLFKDRKLTVLGKDFLEKCEEKRMLIDLAHSEDYAFDTILDSYSGPILNTHTSFYTVFKHRRNAKYQQLRKLINRGGVVGLCFVGKFLGGNKLENVYAHIDWYVSKFGHESLVLGSDFDGISSVVEGLEDIRGYEALADYLIAKGYTESQIEDIFYNNLAGFLKKSLPAN